MKKFTIALLFLFTSIISSQTLIETVDLPSGTFWNYSHGLVHVNGTYWISSSSSSSGSGLFQGIDDQGTLTGTVNINYPGMRNSQGLAYDGTNFWYLERKISRGDLFKVTPSGDVLDSIDTNLFTGSGYYLGGCAWDGNSLWVSVYYPNSDAALYQIDVNTKTIIDTIPTYGTQPMGITFKGDTLFYSMDDNEGDDERVFAVDLATEDTLFSFHVPDQSSQSPRGLAWDGTYFWLLAEPVGGSINERQLFKYDLSGSGTASIDIITPDIDFGNVQIDSTKNLVILINNFGTADLVLDSVVISDNVFSVNENFPLTIEPNTTRGLDVSFTPNAFQAYIDSALFYHNDPNYDYSVVSLTGSGVYTAAYLGLSSSQLQFGNKRINSTSYKELTITNYGSAQLNITSTTLGTSDYYLEHLSLPLTLDSVEEKTFRVWFNPPVYGSVPDTLKLFSNASNGNEIHVPLNGSGAPFDSTLGNIAWLGQVPDNPGTSFNDYIPRSIKKIEDLNNDGVDDIIVCTENYWTIAYNGNSSVTDDILWKFSTHFGSINTGSVDYIQGLQVGDINGDGKQEVVIGTGGGNEFVYVLEGETGDLIWSFGNPSTTSDGDIMGLDIKRDFTGDGINDVLVSASGNEFNGDGRFSVYCLNGLTGATEWQINQAPQQKLKYMVTSTDDGGAFGTRVGSNYEVSGFNTTGSIIWTYSTQSTPWTVREIEDIGGGAGTDVIAGDTGGDIYALSGDAGNLIWTANIGNVFIENLVVVPDVSSDGIDDIFVSGISPTVFMLSGADGSVIWQQFTGGNILGKGIVDDLDGDGLIDVGTASLNSQLYIYNSRVGDELFNYSFGSGNSTAAEHVTAFDDIDGSNVKEFVAGSRDGRIIAFSGGYDMFVSTEDEEFLPSEFSLEQNYPNPFNPATIISYSVPVQSNIKLIIYDVLGREVKTLFNGVKEPGNYKMEWNGTNNFNSKVSTGIYFYRLETDNFVSTKKMLLIK